MEKLKRLFYSFGSAKHFFNLTDWLLPLLVWGCLLLMAVGLVWGLVFAPPDYQQGDSFRIIYLHVPAATVSMSGYLAMAFCALLHLVWRIKLADVAVACIAPVGALFTFIALFTGAVWGKPTWGTWWVWDARLTSMLVLLFLYFGAIALRSAIIKRDLAAKATSWLVLAGVINLPIIKFSVEWWHTLHQPATFKVVGKSGMQEPSMYLPLLVMLAAIYLFFACSVILLMRAHIVLREKDRVWLQDKLGVYVK